MKVDDGILIIDKPAGWTSHDVVRKVKSLLGARKVGHTGTLDPDATGVLVLCINRATRLAGSICELGKAYRAVICLGQSTDTGDASGLVINSQPVPSLQQEEVSAVLPQFKGSIRQRTPRYSAVKVQGRRLYQWARQNREVPRPIRQVEIHRLDLEEWQSPLLRIHVECSKGTYIRSLAEDIGEALKLPAHLYKLRRLRVGPYDVTAALSLEALADELKTGQFWAVQRLQAPQLPEKMPLLRD